MSESALLNSLLLLGLSGTVIAVYLALSYRHDKTLSGCLVCATVLAGAHFVGVPLVLSWLGAATPAVTFLAGLVLLAAVMLAAGLRGRECLANLRGLGQATGSALADLRRFRPARLPLYVFLLLMTGKTVMGLLIRPYTCDAHAYHLPIALNILEHGRYVDVTGGELATRAWHPFMNGFGKNFSLVYFWILAIARQEGFLTLVSLLSGPIAVAAVYRILQSFKVPREAARFAAPLAVFNYFSIIQMNTCMPDQLIATLVVAACMLALRPRSAFTSGLLGVASGLLVGGPRFTVAVVCVPIVLFYLIRPILSAPGRNDGDGHGRARVMFGRHALLVALPLLLYGGHPYVRNLVVYGNPLYPYGFRIAGEPVAGATSADAHIRSSYPAMADRPSFEGLLPSLVKVWGPFTHSSRIGGWGLLFPFVMLPAHLIALILRRRDGAYLLFTALVWTAFFLTPQYYWLRYTLWLFMLSTLPVGVCLARAGRCRAPLMLAVCALGATTAAHAALHMGYRGVLVSSRLAYLALDSPYARTCFLNPHVSLETARAIHDGRLAKDVVYTSALYKYQFHDKAFRNRVVAFAFGSDTELAHFLMSRQLEQAAVVVALDSPEAKVLAASPRFLVAYRNGSEAVYTCKKPARSEAVRACK
ncbi:MAG: hypothetical protein JXR37_16955 [Kiritimatiellae bacterium]|nr:hypothetical protein [Kiritimatiellia bacterium]